MKEAIFYKGFITRIDVPRMEQSISLKMDPKDDMTFDDLLPFEIYPGFEIKRVDWPDFSGEVEFNSPYIAHTYWNITYTYLTEQTLDKQPLQRAASAQRVSSAQRAKTPLK